jgi:hypothetical protein
MPSRLRTPTRTTRLAGLCGLWLAAAASCDCRGGGFPDATTVPDAPLPGAVSLAWSITDLNGAPVSCDQVGATTVFLQLRGQNSASGVAVSLSCNTGSGISQAVAPDTYHVSFELHSGSLTLATAPDQNTVVVRSGAPTALAPVSFQVDAVGNLVFSLAAPPQPSNCKPPGMGAGITATTLTLVHTGDGCAPVTFTRSRGTTVLGTYTVNCGSPVVTSCIENDEALSATGIASGPYTVHIVGKVGANDCWTNDDAVQVPAQHQTRSATLNLAFQHNPGCTP